MPKKNKKANKEKKRRKAYEERKRVLKIMRDHNEVKYRKIPGVPGMWPYQLSPITYGEALTKLKTGKLPVRKGVNNTMTDAQKQRLTDLQALETLAEEEKPVLAALVALQDATAKLEEVKATVTVDPVAEAQKVVDEAQKAYEDAEAAFQATQNGGNQAQPANPGEPTAPSDATPSDATPATGTEATPADATPTGDAPSGDGQPQA